MIPRAFCEFPAGLASVSLRLHGGSKCRPPISRIGNKAGYAEAILWTLGLTAGKSASAYVWAEADDDVRALLQAYPDPAMLLRIAEIIRGWADEEPRALWERLRAERKARTASGAAGEVAAWIQQSVWSYRQGDLTSGGPVLPGDRRQDTTATATATATASLAEFAMLASSNRLINVAAWIQQSVWSYEQGNVKTGFFGPGDGRKDTTATATAIATARMVSNWPPVAVLPRIPSGADLSALLGTPGDLEGVVVYMDPPYLNTTGYLHDLGRGALIGHALDLSGMGATVAISEAEAIPELVAAGWYVADLTAGRKGQKRTFSKQQGEYLTMTSEPRYTIPEQVGLFGTL